MDGTRSETCTEVEAFVRLLETKIALPVDRIEERLSSIEAEDMLKTITPDFRKRKRVLDSVAAQVILMRYWTEK
jgi:putative transcription antitermination factor YqgF